MTEELEKLMRRVEAAAAEEQDAERRRLLADVWMAMTQHRVLMMRVKAVMEAAAFLDG